MAVMPERVLDALQRGDTAEAIRRLRAVTPLDLKSAKDLIDVFRRGQGGLPGPATAMTMAMVRPMHPPISLTSGPRRDVVAEAKVVSDRSAATERLRLASGFGLAQSKDASDASRYRDHPTGVGGRSPGEVPNSGRLIWWIVVIALAGYAMWSGSGSGTAI